MISFVELKFQTVAHQALRTEDLFVGMKKGFDDLLHFKRESLSRVEKRVASAIKAGPIIVNIGSFVCVTILSHRSAILYGVCETRIVFSLKIEVTPVKNREEVCKNYRSIHPCENTIGHCS